MTEEEKREIYNRLNSLEVRFPALLSHELDGKEKKQIESFIEFIENYRIFSKYEGFKHD